jgi:FixJ family two-component response regulator
VPRTVHGDGVSLQFAMAADPINNTSTSRPTVLVVEPDEAEALHIRALLEPLGASVLHFPDGSSLLDVAARMAEATCVISEMTLTDRTGAELIVALRRLGLRMPVILLAAETDVATAVAAMRAGAMDCIEKPQMDRLLPTHLRRLIEDESYSSGHPLD